jgi:hypothetical protein
MVPVLWMGGAPCDVWASQATAEPVDYFLLALPSPASAPSMALAYSRPVP